MLASLNHPHIAAIYGLEEHTLVMELVEGATLVLSASFPLLVAAGFGVNSHGALVSAGVQ